MTEPFEIADFRDGHPERFVPDLMSGTLIDAEHRGRYWWASGLVPGKRTLDAACGTGYGSNILAAAGAAEVVGVDRAAHVIAAARERAASRVRFEVGDLRRLPFDDGGFDVAVCFEAIEHLTLPKVALNELARVLKPDGVLAISSPNRDVYIQGNPHHHHEYVPAELEAALRVHFSHVQLFRQYNFYANAILDDSAYSSGDGTVVEATVARKIRDLEPGAERYTVALASNTTLPDVSPVVVLGENLDVRRSEETVTQRPLRRLPLWRRALRR